MIESTSMCTCCIGRFHQLYMFIEYKNTLESTNGTSAGDDDENKQCHFCYQVFVYYELVSDPVAIKNSVAKTLFAKDFSNNQEIRSCYSCFNFLNLWYEYGEVLGERLEAFYKLNLNLPNEVETKEEDINEKPIIVEKTLETVPESLDNEEIDEIENSPLGIDLIKESELALEKSAPLSAQIMKWLNQPVDSSTPSTSSVPSPVPRVILERIPVVVQEQRKRPSSRLQDVSDSLVQTANKRYKRKVDVKPSDLSSEELDELLQSFNIRPCSVVLKRITLNDVNIAKSTRARKRNVVKKSTNLKIKITKNKNKKKVTNRKASQHIKDEAVSPTKAMRNINDDNEDVDSVATDLVTNENFVCNDLPMKIVVTEGFSDYIDEIENKCSIDKNGEKVLKIKDNFAKIIFNFFSDETVAIENSHEETVGTSDVTSNGSAIPSPFGTCPTINFKQIDLSPFLRELTFDI